MFRSGVMVNTALFLGPEAKPPLIFATSAPDELVTVARTSITAFAGTVGRFESLVVLEQIGL